MTSRHSYDVYKAEMKRIREKSKQYAYTHEYFRKTALTSFRTILEALRREYEQGMTPLLSQLLRTHCMIDPELLDFWDFFLFDSLSNATLDLSREIVEKAGKKPHPSFSEKHVGILLNQLNKLHARYLAPPEGQPEKPGASLDQAISEEQVRLDSLIQQKLALQQELAVIRADRDAAKALAAQRDELQQSVRELQSERERISFLTLEKHDVERELEALKAERDAAAAAPDAERSRMERRINVLEQEKQDLSQEVAELQAELAAASEQQDSAERSRMERRINVLEQEKQDLSQEVAELQAELARKPDQKADAAALAKAELQVNMLESDLRDMRQLNAGLQKALDEQTSRKGGKHDKKQNQAELARAEKRIKALEQEKLDLRQELDDLRESMEQSPDDALRQEADAALEAEKAWLLEELEHETGFRYRFDGTSVRSEEVREMVAGRAAFEESLVNTLNTVNRSFRDSTADASNALTAACEELRKVLEQQTNSAINAVVETSRRLQGTDFRDLLEAFRSLETQVYYKSRSGEDTPEFKEYWKSVRFFLKKFEATLNKLGFLRYVPEIGTVLNPETMEALEASGEDYPVDAEEYPLYTVKEVVSGGFLDKTGEYPEIRALVLAAYQENA
ncbi:MAG: nucleotide exchange factor GrpE [Oscillospiraceae bacterium]|nr:nucleotide exchange factor GrpE [Oscillospiraceae bacterium]